MCGRFTQKYTWQELVNLYRLGQAPRNIQPRYNITPTTIIDVIVPGESGLELVPMRWGLIPFWWKKSAKKTPATFNARVETVATAPMFRSAFKINRCIIPASGYYEWKPVDGAEQPFYFTSTTGAILSIASLWDRWKDIETGDRLMSATMIITDANDLVGAVHDRMPVLLEQEQFESWLTGAAGTEILKPAPNDWLRGWPVSQRVNRAPPIGAEEDPSLIDEIPA
jgi:putative SOS response-associated peptidase YedK